MLKPSPIHCLRIFRKAIFTIYRTDQFHNDHKCKQTKDHHVFHAQAKPNPLPKNFQEGYFHNLQDWSISQWPLIDYV